MIPKAIFFDMDGTLSTHGTHRVPESALAALQAVQAQGIKIFLATGRHPQLFNPTVKTIPFDGHLALNGQFGYNDNEVIYRKTIPQADKQALVAHLRQHPSSIVFFTEDEMYFNLVDEYAERGMAYLGDPMLPVRDPAICLEQNIFALLAYCDERTEAEFMQHMPGSLSVRWSPMFTDVIPFGGGKDKGIDAMLAYYDISLAETMAFGDARNDIGMLSHVGLGVAMGDATEEVKAAADYVTDRLEEDGIATALQHFGVI
ncbi:MAG: Cof-type HAD-IIB family hydrolase [Oscillospiraceae bacterium]|nr:Cof-type HAD-IIB family hydrolase [Oscillospiraceae bacterium]